MKAYLWKLLESWFLKLYWYLDTKQSEHVNQERQVTDKIYQHIGEFVVSFQWLEFKSREIGLYIIDHEKLNFGERQELINLTNEKLIEEVKKLFLDNIKYCFLPKDFEKTFVDRFTDCCSRLHKMRQIRNSILHSAYLEIDSHGTSLGMLKKDNKKLLKKGFDASIEPLTSKSFNKYLFEMAEIGISLNLCLSQLRMRYKCTKEYEEFLNTKVQS